MASRAPPLELALGHELRLLSRLIYKNRNQHQHAKYLRSLVQVHRMLKQLLVEAPADILLGPEGAQQDREHHPLAEDCSLRDLESFKKLPAERLARIYRWMHYVDKEVLPRSTNCARQILGLVSQGFFLPLALTLLCALARCRSLLLQLVDLVASQYNTATESLTDYEAHLHQLGLPAAVRLTGDAPDSRLESIWSFPEVPASSNGEAGLREEGTSVGEGVRRGPNLETEPAEEGRVQPRIIASVGGDPLPGTLSATQADTREPVESAVQAGIEPQPEGNCDLRDAGKLEPAATSGPDDPQTRSDGSERNLPNPCLTEPCLSRQSGGVAEKSPAQGQEKGGIPATSAASEELKRAMLDLGFGDFLGDKRDKKKKRRKSEK